MAVCVGSLERANQSGAHRSLGLFNISLKFFLYMLLAFLLFFTEGSGR